MCAEEDGRVRAQKDTYIRREKERKREREKERESQSHRVERRRRSSVLGLVVGRGPLTFFALESCLLVVY